MKRLLQPRLFSILMLLAAVAVVAMMSAPRGVGGTASTPKSSQLKRQNARSQWVYLDDQGHLAYKTVLRGDKIMDFSFAGYGGGGMAIPWVPVCQTVSPSGGDDGDAIQAAINAVSQRQLVGGFRGAVLLAPGVFHCKEPLVIKDSGVVLRGSGAANDPHNNTIIQMTGKPHLCISIAGSSTMRTVGNPTLIADAYVPAGSTAFRVADASSFKAGDTVLINHPVTPAWVHFMGMDHLVRNGKPQTWISGSISTERTIGRITGNMITLDIPLSDCLDARYLNPPGSSVIKCDNTGQISQVGVENLKIVAPAQVVSINQPQHHALHIQGVTDAWVRNIAIVDTINSVSLSSDTRRITVDNVQTSHSVATVGAAKPADFATNGTQTLFNHCSSTGNNLFYFVTGARVTGPNVLLNCTFRGNGHIQPHQRWATGLLVDGCRVSESGIDFMNRGEMGSGHGWTIGWSVAWNCLARSYVIQQPPGAANWAIGCQGTPETDVMPFGDKTKAPRLPEGIFDSHGTPVMPPSLYLAQLRERLGEQALKNIGYASRVGNSRSH
ncbi:MAG: hypothetical protein JO316_08780 [Abitibacteriaceae bacterium]|nr:hypothetical protein [Abditibacteriaceae bacterium]